MLDADLRPSSSFASEPIRIRAENLGSASFRREYGLRYAYLAGAMYKGIASRELVAAMGRAGMMGFLGTGGMALDDVANAIDFLRAELGRNGAYGMNLLANQSGDLEARTVDLFLGKGVRRVEASSYMQLSPSVVRYRLSGAVREPSGRISVPNFVMAKISRPEVAQEFMRAAPAEIVSSLADKDLLTAEEAALAPLIPMASDLCVEGDSGGHTDQGVLLVQLPSFIALRNRLATEFPPAGTVRIGAAGGIGSPEAAAAAFALGAEFIVTGSINQCTIEADTSEEVKDILAGLNVQDTTYAPAGDLFELGAKVQVAKKGLLFPTRANKLYSLYEQYRSLEEIPQRIREQIEKKYFKKSFEEVWQETERYLRRADPGQLTLAEKSPKQKMAMIFRWYFVHSNRLARAGSSDQRVDYQVQSGPAMGACNQWLMDSPLEDWRSRGVADLGQRMMQGAAEVLSQRVGQMLGEA